MKTKEIIKGTSREGLIETIDLLNEAYEDEKKRVKALRDQIEEYSHYVTHTIILGRHASFKEFLDNRGYKEIK